MWSRALILLAVGGLALGGCGSDEEAAPEVRRKQETAGKLPPLPVGFEEYVNRDAGVALGRPPGWNAKAKGPATTLTAPDGLVTAVITADRTDDALEVRPKDFALATARLVPGYEEPLDPKRAKPFDHEYEAAIATAKGVRKRDGLRQITRVAVLRRKGVAVVTAVIAENAEEPGAALGATQALESIRTLRTRPPG